MADETERADRTDKWRWVGRWNKTNPSDLSDASASAGIALLEVLIALTILGTAGLSVVSLLQQATQAQGAVHREEMAMEVADRVLSALTLLTRPELDQRLGQHALGEFAIDIERPERGLYRIAVAELSVPDRTLLVTVVQRVESAQP